jgi:hypothetical protein
LTERCSGVFLELCWINGSGEGDIILNYINYINEPDLVKCIKSNSLKWAGQVMGMDNNRITKRMFNTRPEGKG